MMRFLKRLFAIDNVVDESRRGRDAELAVEISPRSPRNGNSDRYFDTMLQLREAISNQEYEDAAKLARLNLSYIPGWVKESCQQDGSLRATSIPALEQGGTILALVGDVDGLTSMQEIVGSTVELDPWAKRVERHQDDLSLFEMILNAVRRSPGCLQTDVKGLIDEEDGRRVATLISYLEKAGKVVRIKKGRTYELTLAGSSMTPKPQPKRIVRSHRNSPRSPRPREIDLSALVYVPLPRAPARWEEGLVTREREKVLELAGHFEVHDADWRIESIEGIPLAGRPDPAFRRIHTSDSGLLMIDDLGKAEGFGEMKRPRCVTTERAT